MAWVILGTAEPKRHHILGPLGLESPREAPEPLEDNWGYLPLKKNAQPFHEHQVIDSDLWPPLEIYLQRF